MHGFLLFLGAGLVLVGMSSRALESQERCTGVKHSPTATSPISQAMGGPVEIKGNIVPIEKGLVRGTPKRPPGSVDARYGGTVSFRFRRQSRGLVDHSDPNPRVSR